jgi:hypothetical protein
MLLSDRVEVRQTTRICDEDNLLEALNDQRSGEAG